MDWKKILPISLLGLLGLFLLGGFKKFMDRFEAY